MSMPQHFKYSTQIPEEWLHEMETINMYESYDTEIDLLLELSFTPYIFSTL